MLLLTFVLVEKIFAVKDFTSKFCKQNFIFWMIFILVFQQKVQFDLINIILWFAHVGFPLFFVIIFLWSITFTV